MSEPRSPMAPVIAGSNVCVGHIYNRGKLGVEAFDADTKTLGLFADEAAAAAKIVAAHHEKEIA